MNNAAMSDAAMNDSVMNDYTNYDPTINDSVMIEPIFCDSLELGQYIDTNIYKVVYNNGMAILDKYYRNSPINLGGVDDILVFNTLLVSWDKSA
jgi:hypothetical protein